MLPRSNSTYDLDPFADRSLQRALRKSNNHRTRASDDDPTIRAHLYDAALTLVNLLRNGFLFLATTLRSLLRTFSASIQHARRDPAAYRRATWKFTKRRMWSVTTWLIVIWFVVLYWGEVKVFNDAVDDCSWENWEQWPQTAIPHHLTLLTDPQLVDAHTYPSRPWPLSTLTIWHTDLYLRRAYSRIQTRLDPHSVVFLGDLFDGGREWGTRESSSPEERWRGYGRAYWLWEFRRFWRVFGRESAKSRRRDVAVRDNSGADMTDTGAEVAGDVVHVRKDGHEQGLRRDGRQILASLPGNHDLGFGRGIQLPVRQRFQAYFGESNRIDVIGNHTFVSIDSVSLSAKDQRGSEGNEAIWQASWEFLEHIHEKKREEVDKYLRWLWDEQRYGMEDGTALDPSLYDLQNATDLVLVEKMSSQPALSNRLAEHLSSLASRQPNANANAATEANTNQAHEQSETLSSRHNPRTAGLPTILLTHVPLYRPPNTPCGPLRERGTSIPISAGYQYQNTLTSFLTDHIFEVLSFNLDGPDTGHVVRVFSGDDHDYCELVHTPSDALKAKGRDEKVLPGYEGLYAQLRIPEITVKSISWAMGVRKPGFLLVSLWNPIDEYGITLPRPPALRRARPLHEIPASDGDLAASAARQEEAQGLREDTVQTHLCLLPDELSILIRYGLLLVFSLVVLLVRAIYIVLRGSSVQDDEVSLLPSYNSKAKVEDGEHANGAIHGSVPYARKDSRSWHENGNGNANAYVSNPYPYPNPTGTTSSTASKPTGTRRPRGYSTPLQPSSSNLGSVQASPIERILGSPITNPNGLVQQAGFAGPGHAAQSATMYSPIDTKRKLRGSDEFDVSHDARFASGGRSRWWSTKGRSVPGHTGKRGRDGCSGILREFSSSLRFVACIVIGWYVVLWNFS